MQDPFAQDAQRREALEAELIGIRIALAEAHELQDAEAGLRAINALYQFRERYPDLEVAYMPGGEQSVGFALATTAIQMVSKFDGWCSVCTNRIPRGVMMYWDKETREAICSRCSINEFHGGAR